MKMRCNKISGCDFLFEIEVLLLSLTIIFMVFEKSSLVSTCFYATFIVELFLLLYLSIQKGYTKDSLLLLLVFIVVIALINVTINAIINGANLHFDYYKKYISFVSTILFFYLASLIKLSKSCIRFTYITISLVFIFLIFVFFKSPDLAFYFPANIAGTHDYLTFGFPNPNLTALFLACFLCVFLFAFIISKSKILKLLYGVLTLFSFFFLIKTRARNALVAVIVLLFFLLFYCIEIRKKHDNDAKRFRFINIVAQLFPLVFVIVYISLLQITDLHRALSFFESEGKVLDSRYYEWLNSIKLWVKHFLVGDYYGISAGTGVSQALNTAIDLNVSYGTVCYILVMFFQIRVFSRIAKESSDYCKYALICAFGILLCGIGEAALYAGGTGLSVFAAVLPFVANSIKKDLQ